MKTLDEILANLQRFGKPRLGIYGGDGLWSCKVEMFVSGLGLSFDVRSEYDHATPLEAAEVCEKRMMQALNDIRAKAAESQVPPQLAEQIYER